MSEHIPEDRQLIKGVRFRCQNIGGHWKKIQLKKLVWVRDWVISWLGKFFRVLRDTHFSRL